MQNSSRSDLYLSKQALQLLEQYRKIKEQRLQIQQLNDNQQV
ncbi:MAG: hypothetical protein ACK56F_30815 [bacterium]